MAPGRFFACLQSAPGATPKSVVARLLSKHKLGSFHPKIVLARMLPETEPAVVVLTQRAQLSKSAIAACMERRLWLGLGSAALWELYEAKLSSMFTMRCEPLPLREGTMVLHLLTAALRCLS